MKIGMLWFDNDPHTELAAKVERAAAYYRLKYGKTPTLCFVHPSMLPGAQDAQPQEAPNSPGGKSAGQAPTGLQADQAMPGKPRATAPSTRKNRRKEKLTGPEAGTLLTSGVEVRTNPAVRPHHFWIGINGVSPVSSTTSTSKDRSAGISPDLTLSSASSSR